MRVNLTAVYASGLPNGAPLLQDPYQYTRTLPAYKRVDIGLSKVFVDAVNRPNSRFLDNFKEMTLGVQIFNAFNISNTVANQWIADVQSTRAYPVPVRLTGRFFNVKLEFKL